MITLEEAVKRCNNELAFAIHMEECAPNLGLQVIYRNKAEWLCQVLYAAREHKKDVRAAAKICKRGGVNMFELGDWVIETKRHRSGEVIAIIPAGHYAITTLYIVQFSDNKYEIFDESILTAYDKYYWDNLEESVNG